MAAESAPERLALSILILVAGGRAPCLVEQCVCCSCPVRR